MLQKIFLCHFLCLKRTFQSLKEKKNLLFFISLIYHFIYSDPVGGSGDYGSGDDTETGSGDQTEVGSGMEGSGSGYGVDSREDDEDYNKWKHKWQNKHTKPMHPKDHNKKKEDKQQFEFDTGPKYHTVAPPTRRPNRAYTQRPHGHNSSNVLSSISISFLSCVLVVVWTVL